MRKVVEKSAKGAAIGGIVGLVIPGIGTIAGASIGAAIGALAGQDSSIKEHIDAWYKYKKANIQSSEEDGQILAGRQAEDLLRNIVDEHYQFRGCHSFSGKRIFNPALNHKNEIDMIVVTDKKLYVIECKNWSGRLVKRNDKWIQIKESEEKEHNDVLIHNVMKKNLLLSSLRGIGINIMDTDCIQKVIFMNSRLSIESPEIYNNPDVVTPDKLNDYLNNQKTQLEPHQKMFASIISLILDSESSSKIIDGLFSRLGGKDHTKIVQFINELPTWDKIKLFGTKILSGDIIRDNIYSSAYKVPFEKIKKIKIRIVRSEGLFLVKSILKLGRPIGLDLYDSSGRILLKTKANPEGVFKFIPAGNPDFIEVPILEVDEIIYGKHIT